MDAFTYIIECADGTFYTGWTVNVEKRLQAHNAKKGAKYTKTRVPVRLVYVEKFSTKRFAQQREYAIKRLTRAKKVALIKQQAL